MSDLMNRALWMWRTLGVLEGCAYLVVKRMVHGSDESCTFVQLAMTVSEVLRQNWACMSALAFGPDVEVAGAAEVGGGTDPATRTGCCC
ncbi:unnamed protein product [Phytophthora fragariaefolia]|uniref:Unnamed protein product n=1 Tax=Phytophthora fragariaefolia TaxID=1490495 RepID=A0A9W6U5E7_9STRA|nr:unnamed protein product [Phytophthora fragariaefolia]